LGGIWGENSRKPMFGFRLSGGKGILQRSQPIFCSSYRNIYKTSDFRVSRFRQFKIGKTRQPASQGRFLKLYQAFGHIGSTGPHFRQSTLPTVAAFLFDIQSHFQKTYAGNKIILPRLANIPAN
ncbi:hypothetical protein ACNF4B_08885, partial [Neisseria meningitidis]|uniref:hypothetical protein n=3 Tax=Neisseria meningitidis TaxID=487 RepID=UPI003A811BEF